MLCGLAHRLGNACQALVASPITTKGDEEHYVYIYVYTKYHLLYGLAGILSESLPK